MSDQELVDFVKWLPKNIDTFKGMSLEEIVSKVNKMSTSSEGKGVLKQLTKQYKNTKKLKNGGTLGLISCLKKGGSIQSCGCGKKVEKAQLGASVKKKAYGEGGGLNKLLQKIKKTKK